MFEALPRDKFQHLAQKILLIGLKVIHDRGWPEQGAGTLADCLFAKDPYALNAAFLRRTAQYGLLSTEAAGFVPKTAQVVWLDLDFWVTSNEKFDYRKEKELWQIRKNLILTRHVVTEEFAKRLGFIPEQEKLGWDNLTEYKKDEPWLVSYLGACHPTEPFTIGFFNHYNNNEKLKEFGLAGEYLTHGFRIDFDPGRTLLVNKINDGK